MRNAIVRWPALVGIAVAAATATWAATTLTVPPKAAAAAADPQALRSGNFFLQTVNGFSQRVSVPAGIVVTDMVFSRTSGGAVNCEVQPTFGAGGLYLGRFNVARSEMKHIGLTTGLASAPGGQVSFVATTGEAAGCTMYIGWTGYAQ